jgi:pyruvate/2-oxoglutarate dehydrogenase complex dihydrolipoamide dehydrogenase (E3) component
LNRKNWIAPKNPEAFDAVLIGAGQANNPLSRTLARAGKRVALIEKGKIGGTCVNTGCTPTKTMAASARLAHLTRRASEYGVHAGVVEVRLEEVRDRARVLVEEFGAGSERKLEATEGLELILGEGSFTGPHAVRVELNGGGTRELSSGEPVPWQTVATGITAAGSTLQVRATGGPAGGMTEGSLCFLTSLAHHQACLGAYSQK